MEKQTSENKKSQVSEVKSETDEDKGTEPKSVKDLFTEFKPSPVNSDDGSGIESEMNNDEEYQPNTKKRKTIKPESSPKKRAYTQKYRREWEAIPAYKQWLTESVLGNQYFYCKFCKNDNKCGRTEIEKHMTSMKHVRNSKIPPLQVR